MKMFRPLAEAIENFKWQSVKSDYAIGDLIEDCRYEPSRITGITRDNRTHTFTYATEGLVSGFKGTCGAGCGVRPVDDLEASKDFYRRLSKARNDEVAMELVMEWEDSHKKN
jgi:hypothetical protein